MKKHVLLLCALLGAFVVTGCGSSEASATKAEEEAFRNPPKEMPKEAMEAMARGGGGKPSAAK